ncbi:hypothetical protein AAMO2058_000863600 [Amorphochlora amoebiformis]
MIKLPESEMENRCVILEVVHKPLKLSQMDELYYLDGDDKQDDDTRDKIPIRSTEQLREQMERGGAIKVVCSSYYYKIRWQVREEMGVDEIEI